MCFEFKRLFSVFLITCIILFNPRYIYADDYHEKLADGWVTAKYTWSQMGTFFFGDLDKTIANSESLKSYFDNGVKTTETTKDGKTTVTIDPDFTKALYDATLQALSDYGDYIVITDSGYSPTYFVGYAGKPTDITLKQEVITMLSGINYFYNLSGSTRYFFPVDDSQYYYYKDGTSYYCYNSLTNESHGVNGYYLANTGYVDGGTGTVANSDTHKYYRGTPLRVFKSKYSLLRYLNDGSSFYVGSNFYNFNPQGSLTINKDVLYGNDWDKVNSDMYSNIKNAIDDASADGSVLSPGEQQAIIDDLVNKLLDAIGSVNDNLGDMSGTLDSILSSITSSGNNQVAWLSKIYDLLNTKLESLGGSGSSGGGITSEQFDAIITRLDSTNSKLDTLISQADDLSKEIEDSGGMNSLMGGLFTKFQPLGEKAKTKFPTSIPWDVGLVVSKLASTPECPRYVLPLKLPAYGVNQEVVLDLKDFEPLSKASRSMLSLTFILFLAILTRNLFGGDK
ncbi:hypothetical protein [Lactonifactor longoviformis]|uniref:hypothetical protein n=1 Tax=Lactonifactor longoviformis TaxID=341220 RepID=UPI001D0304E5|nr:hypothetical protein [Lactonifactor longoviformis]MCB5712130.1 hypothetical protein [Lactonifactor longoviformis]MCB5716174.1 hypothetical protein [Lactonifactor longoviformis]